MLLYKIAKRKNPRNKAQTIYSPALIHVKPVTLDDVSREIAEECTVTSADVKAVLDRLQLAIIRHLLQGHSVRLGDMGSFHLRLWSKGKEDRRMLSLSDIKSLHVRFRSSAKLSRYLSMHNPQIKLKRSILDDLPY